MKIVKKGVSYTVLVETDTLMKLTGLVKNVLKWNLWSSTNR